MACLPNTDDTKANKEAFDDLRQVTAHLASHINSTEDVGKNMLRQDKVKYKRAQQAIINEAHVLYATLCMNGSV